MNREIKFRGRSINGDWHFGFVSVVKIRMNHVHPGTYISNKTGMPFAYQVIPETVGQYTGLKDKNFKGKEIYQGDVFSDNSVVVWYKDSWCVERSFGGKYHMSLDQYINYNPEREVIGNIHDKTE